MRCTAISSTSTIVKKRLYAVLWIDDYGSLTLRKRDVRWYHENAGPLSLAVQCDERFPWGFDLAFGTVSKEGIDYLSHHIHPEHYVGSRTPKRVYDALRLHYLVWSFLRNFTALAARGFFRYTAVIAAPVTVLLLAALFVSNLVAFVVVFGLCVCAAALLVTWWYVRLPRNWEYTFSNRAAIAQSIANAKAAFAANGLAYPTVIRHGWNLPLPESMPFYIELGVNADASAVPRGADRHPQVNGYEIEWHQSQPYVTSLSRGYAIAWDGGDPSDAGLLELPVTLGNIAAYGFGEKDRKLIDGVPDGGLVSCYIHPQDSFSPVRQWVKYLKLHFDVQFVSAERAAYLFRARLTEAIESRSEVDV